MQCAVTQILRKQDRKIHEISKNKNRISRIEVEIADYAGYGQETLGLNRE